MRETRLSHLIAQVLPGLTIVRYHRPDWLERLELDIWIPELRVGVEHQGQQHYAPVAARGGDAALEQVQERDARKVALAAKAGITLVHFRFDEPLTADHVTRRLNTAGVPVKAQPRPTPLHPRRFGTPTMHREGACLCDEPGENTMLAAGDLTARHE